MRNNIIISINAEVLYFRIKGRRGKHEAGTVKSGKNRIQNRRKENVKRT
jgi:hypothetical protein